MTAARRRGRRRGPAEKRSLHFRYPAEFLFQKNGKGVFCVATARVRAVRRPNAIRSKRGVAPHPTPRLRSPIFQFLRASKMEWLRDLQ